MQRFQNYFITTYRRTEGLLEIQLTTDDLELKGQLQGSISRNARPIGKPVWPVQQNFLRLEKLQDQEWPTTRIRTPENKAHKLTKQPRCVTDLSYTCTCKTSSHQVYDTCDHFSSSLQVIVV